MLKVAQRHDIFYIVISEDFQGGTFQVNYTGSQMKISYNPNLCFPKTFLLNKCRGVLKSAVTWTNLAQKTHFLNLKNPKYRHGCEIQRSDCQSQTEKLSYSESCLVLS